MKSALASTDRTNVNQHFGKAEHFLIYDTSGEGLVFVEAKPVTPLSDNDPDHPFNADKFGNIVQALSGCEKVYVTKIGDKPAEELQKAGIEPVVYEGPIDKMTT